MFLLHREVNRLATDLSDQIEKSSVDREVNLPVTDILDQTEGSCNERKVSRLVTDILDQTDEISGAKMTKRVDEKKVIIPKESSAESTLVQDLGTSQFNDALIPDKPEEVGIYKVSNYVDVPLVIDRAPQNSELEADSENRNSQTAESTYEMFQADEIRNSLGSDSDFGASAKLPELSVNPASSLENYPNVGAGSTLVQDLGMSQFNNALIPDKPEEVGIYEVSNSGDPPIVVIDGATQNSEIESDSVNYNAQTEESIYEMFQVDEIPNSPGSNMDFGVKLRESAENSTSSVGKNPTIDDGATIITEPEMVGDTNEKRSENIITMSKTRSKKKQSSYSPLMPLMNRTKRKRSSTCCDNVSCFCQHKEASDDGSPPLKKRKVEMEKADSVRAFTKKRGELAALKKMSSSQRKKKFFKKITRGKLTGTSGEISFRKLIDTLCKSKSKKCLKRN